jgi:WD40 repeat protein
VSALALSPAGDLLALGRGDEVEVRAVPGLEVLKRARLPGDGPASAASLAWDLDGTRLAACGLGGMAVLGAQDLRAHQVASRPGARMLAAAFDPAGNVVAFGGEPREVELMTIATGATRTVVGLQPFGVTTLVFSPDGQFIAAGDESCDVWGYDIASGARVMHGKHHMECYVTCSVWAQDGTLMFGCREHPPGVEPAPVATSAPRDLTASADLAATRER